MKPYYYVLLGIGLTLFTVMGINTFFPKIFIKDDNRDADNVFNEYLSDKLQQKQIINTQKGIVDDYIQNLIAAKGVVDVMHFSIDTIRTKNSSDSLAALQKLGADIYSKDRQLQNYLLDSSANQYVTKASTRIRNSISNEFRDYESLWYSNSILYSYRTATEALTRLGNQQTFKIHQETISTTILQQITGLTSASTAYKTTFDALDTTINRAKIAQKYATENSRDQTLITMVIPIFAIMLGIIIFIPYLLKSDSILFNKILDDKILIQVFTIFILVISILLLGIGNKLSGETLGTLLGGISVYVLQKSMEQQR